MSIGDGNLGMEAMAVTGREVISGSEAIAMGIEPIESAGAKASIELTGCGRSIDVTPGMSGSEAIDMTPGTTAGIGTTPGTDGGIGETSGTGGGIGETPGM